jgi:hypothetical protein
MVMPAYVLAVLALLLHVAIAIVLMANIDAHGISGF